MNPVIYDDNLSTSYQWADSCIPTNSQFRVYQATFRHALNSGVSPAGPLKTQDNVRLKPCENTAGASLRDSPRAVRVCWWRFQDWCKKQSTISHLNSAKSLCACERIWLENLLLRFFTCETQTPVKLTCMSLDYVRKPTREEHANSSVWYVHYMY